MSCKSPQIFLILVWASQHCYRNYMNFTLISVFILLSFRLETGKCSISIKPEKKVLFATNFSAAINFTTEKELLSPNGHRVRVYITPCHVQTSLYNTVGILFIILKLHVALNINCLCGWDLWFRVLAWSQLYGTIEPFDIW